MIVRNNRTSLKKHFCTPLFTVFIFIAAMLGIGQSVIAAPDANTDYDTGYQAFIEDDADLLTDTEETDLYELLQELTLYGNVAFKTIDYNEYSSTEGYILNYYDQKFGQSSGGVFLIDMDYRNIWIRCHGEMSKIITNAYTDTITDNVYTFASDGDYYECAYEAFAEMLILLQGNKIAQPMKYLSNAFLAVILGLIITYFIVKLTSRASKPSEKELLEGTRYSYQFNHAEAVFNHQTKKYDPPSSGSGGGGGGGGGGGSSGGHSF